jgi:DNA-binding transcriptional MerR regulator
MFRIGDFSRIARVSARLLRFYDEIGLFAPAHADAQTGYRSYTVAQLGELNRITVLKELGFSLEQVRDLLKSPPGAVELRSMLQLRRLDVERTLAMEAQRLRQIETRIAQIEAEGRLSADDVIVRSEPARQLLGLRRTVPSFQEARAVIAAVRERAATLLPRRHAGQLVVVAHASQFEAEELDLEIGFAFEAVPFAAPPPASELVLRELPAVERMAVCVRAGPPEEAHLVTARIGRYLELSGDTLAGPSREVFLQLPPADRMQESVVEMQYPLGPGDAITGWR